MRIRPTDRRTATGVVWGIGTVVVASLALIAFGLLLAALTAAVAG